MADEAGRKPTLSAPQEKALAALLDGATVTAAAETAGVSRQTCSSWLNGDADFIAEYQNRRADLWAAAMARAEGAMPAAMDALVALLKDPQPRVRLAAAPQILGPLFGRPGASSVPAVTTPEAIRKEWARKRRDAERFDLLFDTLA